MSFARKLHHIVAATSYDTSNNESTVHVSVAKSDSIIQWRSHGRAFRLLVTKHQPQVLQFYFGHSDFNVLLQDLHNHGFRRLTKGRDRNCFYHEVSKLIT